MTDDDSELVTAAWRAWRIAKPEHAELALPSADDPLAGMLCDWFRQVRPHPAVQRPDLPAQFAPQQPGETRLQCRLRSGGE